MTLLNILHHPHPILRQKAQSVTHFDSALLKTLQDLFDTMYANEGIGLAANQVGILSQFFVMDLSLERNQPRCIINPNITQKKGQLALQEGCLSLPGIEPTISRAKEIVVTYQDEYGVFHTRECEGYEAVCIQHETDHLFGKLSIDHLSGLKRTLALKKFEKYKKQKE